MKVLNINFRSLNNTQTRDEFHALLNHVKPDIVVGSETWLSSEVHDAEIAPEDLGYEIFRRDRSSRGGGVLILVSRKYIACREEKFESDCEILWVKVEIVGSKPLHIAAYYRPHESDSASQEQLRYSLEKVNEASGHIWLLGDFNLPKFSWEGNLPSLKQDCSYPSLYDDFADILADFNLTQMVTEPTRYENILDLFLTNNPTLVSKVEIMSGLSDHDIVYSEVNIKPQIVVQRPRVMPVYRKADWNALTEHMLLFRESFMLDHETKSLNRLWLDFKTALQDGIDKHVPKKTISSKDSLPWITQDIKRNIRKRDSLYQKYKKTRTRKDREEFVAKRHQVRHKLSQAHNQYLETILGISKSEDNAEPGKPSCSTKKLYTLLNRSKNDTKGISSLSTGGNLYSNTKDKADILNNQFQSVFTPKTPLALSKLAQMKVQDQVDAGRIDPCKIDPKSVPAGCLNNQPVMPEILLSEAGILKLLHNLNPNKAAGPDELKPLVLKELREVIAPMVRIIFQRSMETGRVPKDWNDANVCPLFKKGDKTIASNYRPISLTCILCKVLEHIVASNLVTHLDSQNLLYDLQHGFRSKRSCETQLVSLVEDMTRNAIKGQQTDLVLLDFSKAFDKVSHEKLLLKLHQYGIRGNVLHWIKAFLSNRFQTVVLENEKSSQVAVTSGVPQGSVLGPILFLVYINDLPDSILSKVRLFADDTAVYLAVSNLKDATVLQKDLDRLGTWSRKWDMEFNPSKCTVIHVTRSNDPVPSQYTLYGQVLESVTSSKYLGVTINDHLTWNDHIQNTVTSANRTLGFIRRNIRTKDPSIREVAYKTLVRPVIEYSSPVWSPHHTTQINKVEMVQRRAARWTLSRYSPYDSVSRMLGQLGWRSLEDRRTDARLCLFYKIVHGLVAVPMPPYVVHPRVTTRRSSSHPLAFIQIHTAVDYYKYSFFPLAIVQWNRLPPAVALLPYLESFRLAVSSLSYSMP
ncbi:MAG: hypothetical protein JAY75_12610 [Candidatus Thiodiazotropha taylori]|nr:hypothetical protein [Candidatus Thiodiazotropha taylori]MCG8077071.1 hypothetical protein [Candidatus Thiodiazotropha taylori]MCW4309059.1 reverse transcriptase domain-containing protein [Candidatus Thiodiazotropha endolucinida]